VSYMKRLMDEHGICESYIDAQDDHYGCDLYSDHKCDLLDYGEWQIKYQHGLIRKAKQVIEESEGE